MEEKIILGSVDVGFQLYDANLLLERVFLMQKRERFLQIGIGKGGRNEGKSKPSSERFNM